MTIEEEDYEPPENDIDFEGLTDKDVEAERKREREREAAERADEMRDRQKDGE